MFSRVLPYPRTGREAPYAQGVMWYGRSREDSTAHIGHTAVNPQVYTLCEHIETEVKVFTECVHISEIIS